MKTNILIIILSFIAINIFAQHTGSDVGKKLIDDYKYIYTLPEDIQSLTIGMNYSKIKNSLHVEPYDIHFLDEDNHKLLVYRYIIVENAYTKSSKSGEYWNGSIGQLFILLEDNKIKSFITDQGKGGVITVLSINNRIKLANGDNDIIDKNDVLYYQSTSQIKVDTSKKEQKTVAPVETTKKKKPGKTIAIVLGVVATIVLIPLALEFMF